MRTQGTQSERSKRGKEMFKRYMRAKGRDGTRLRERMKKGLEND